jgi:hypothetical protein
VCIKILPSFSNPLYIAIISLTDMYFYHSMFFVVLFSLIPFISVYFYSLPPLFISFRFSAHFSDLNVVYLILLQATEYDVS